MCVIRVMVGSRAQRRPMLSVLLIGLILLVASHLVGALHGPGFLGPHEPVTLTASTTPSTTAVEPLAFGPEHGHGHDIRDDSVEHSVDRVRASTDRPAHAANLVEPVVDRPVTGASPGPAAPRGGAPPPAGGRSPCVRLCVWRQ